ncbi:unnamed protein product [Toxocara canis]|uniref:Zinc transporter 1 n=1 Tax=Toxocara canis TaxID=6265 RepID=A0A183UQU0_TOXCA|nr:unnamed protein product [Toxocara canis]
MASIGVDDSTDDHLPLKNEEEEKTNRFVNGLEKKATSVLEEPGEGGSANKKPFMTRGARMIIMLSMTFAFFVVEMVCGYLSHSMALIADSFHMLSDVMALLIAFICLKMSERSSKKNTFGWVRAEVLGALINGVFLLALCFSIAIESLTRLVEPEKIKEPRQVLIVGTVGFLINLIGMFMFHSHSHAHADNERDTPSKPRSARRQTHVTIDGLESQHLMSSHQEGAMALAQLNHDIENELSGTGMSVNEGANVDTKTKGKSKGKRGMSTQLNMRGVFLHVLSDAVGSVIVIITALVSWLVPGHDILKLYLDPGLSLMMVLLLVASTFPLVRETALILMQTTPGFIEVEELENSLLKIDGVLAVHEFHVWRLVGERIIATVHIRFSDLKAYLAAADQIRTLFHDNCIHSTTIQPEFSEMVDTLGYNGSHCALACLPENCKRTDVTCCRRDSPPSTREREMVPDQWRSNGEGEAGIERVKNYPRLFEYKEKRG